MSASLKAKPLLRTNRSEGQPKRSPGRARPPPPGQAVSDRRWCQRWALLCVPRTLQRYILDEGCLKGIPPSTYRRIILKLFRPPLSSKKRILPRTQGFKWQNGLVSIKTIPSSLIVVGWKFLTVTCHDETAQECKMNKDTIKHYIGTFRLLQDLLRGFKLPQIIPKPTYSGVPWRSGFRLSNSNMPNRTPTPLKNYSLKIIPKEILP